MQVCMHSLIINDTVITKVSNVILPNKGDGTAFKQITLTQEYTTLKDKHS